MKSKSARGVGFEVNEFGEIIRPSKSLGEISTEDLSKLEEEIKLKNIDVSKLTIEQLRRLDKYYDTIIEENRLRIKKAQI